MKTKLVLTVILTSFLFLYGCSDNEKNAEESGLGSQSSTLSGISSESEKSNSNNKSNSIDNEYLQAQQEVIETFGAIAQSIIDGDIDKLISFHAYGPKFTEFNNGTHRVGSAENEAHEREVFGAVTEVERFAADDLKVAVYYGNVANVTFHSDFILWFGETRVEVPKNQITLLFVKTNGEWKLVHEHHSPLN
ncbi:YybH family protein [Aestuariivivens sediminis]|uniref:YybH family protein n=1 Tax=Aestuariivivens sediminis TaxID=2913557 RepID=UPI001F56AAC4|nr:nuclear transport factor 2 family protein [Aestuariivivens sediminis]